MSTFEFIVAGPPISYQTRTRPRLKTWQAQVRAAAAARWALPEPMSGAIRIAVSYFHDSPAVVIDLDNMVKPVLDALIGLVYQDDQQVTDLVIRKSDLNGSFVVRDAQLLLLESLARGEPFLYVSVSPAPSHSNFLR